jgi:TolB-like protein/Tfp pilus assembly protein PilF
VAAVSVLLILHFAGLRDRVSGAKGAGTIESLAVLPFVNAGGDPDTEYLSDGITENLINKLSQLPELKVMSSSSVFRYKGQERDAQKAGRELGVRAVLSGRLLQRGDGLSISVELLDTRDNTNIWGERYNRRLEDMIALEEEISRTITDKLRIRLTSEDERRLTRRSTESGAAYRLYLRGRYHSNKLTVEDIDKAIGYFEQAIEVDPGYAAAFSGLADAYTFLGTDLGFLPHRDAFPKARDAAFAALEIDGACAEAHAALAFARFLDWDWVGAETAFKRALELNPDSVIARDQYSCYLAHMGRLDEAIEEVKCAIESDPLALLPNSDLSYYYVLARRFEEALRQIEMIMNLESNFVLPYWNLGLLYNAQSRYEEAIAQLTKAKALSGNNPVIDADLARAYAGADRQDEALGLLRELEKMSRRRYVSQGIVALVHIGLGQKEEAFDRLEAAYADQDFFLAKLKVDPRFDPLRSDPRFADLLRRMDFPD